MLFIRSFRLCPHTLEECLRSTDVTSARNSNAMRRARTRASFVTSMLPVAPAPPTLESVPAECGFFNSFVSVLGAYGASPKEEASVKILWS